MRQWGFSLNKKLYAVSSYCANQKPVETENKIIVYFVLFYLNNEGTLLNRNYNKDILKLFDLPTFAIVKYSHCNLE